VRRPAAEAGAEGEAASDLGGASRDPKLIARGRGEENTGRRRRALTCGVRATEREKGTESAGRAGEKGTESAGPRPN